MADPVANGVAAAFAGFVFPELTREAMASMTLAFCILAVVCYIAAEAVRNRHARRLW